MILFNGGLRYNYCDELLGDVGVQRSYLLRDFGKL
jgi:hypothetical protein